MNRFEFLVEGPPVSLNVKNHNPKRYQRWIKTVREAARKEWPVSAEPIRTTSVSVTIVNYHTGGPPDVDNIIKPILDAMNGVVYEDDKQVYRVISERFAMDGFVEQAETYPPLAQAMARCNEVAHIAVRWTEGRDDE